MSVAVERSTDPRSIMWLSMSTWNAAPPPGPVQVTATVTPALSLVCVIDPGVADDALEGAAAVPDATEAPQAPTNAMRENTVRDRMACLSLRWWARKLTAP